MLQRRPRQRQNKAQPAQVMTMPAVAPAVAPVDSLPTIVTLAHFERYFSESVIGFQARSSIGRLLPIFCCRACAAASDKRYYHTGDPMSDFTSVYWRPLTLADLLHEAPRDVMCGNCGLYAIPPELRRKG